ncbi:uncharacterized protein LOC132287110 isoform X2 [Cornus florida]|uniref:uncharacterized protein LOC132287110 isoform X2 n=1 Tax=Cornus florida TaxID=4283 RepID=UPI00289E187E|nr:uncharacterized protein LOC132287110 isoform X2 [Cornus florida]
MATEADIPETIFVKKKEEEDKELTSECLNTTVNEISQEGMNKVEPWHNQTPETIKFLEKSADMQVATKTEVQNVNAVIEGNVETIEGEFFLASPLVTKVAREETSRVAEDYQAAEKPTQAEKEVPKNETIREDKLENQNVEIVENKEASLEKFKWNTDKELRSSEKDEKGVTMTEEKTDFESIKQTLDMLEASSGQNAGALVQTPDLTEDENIDSGKLKEAYDKEDSIDNAFSTKTTSTEENVRETSFQGGTEKEPEASFHSMSKAMDLEAIQPNKNIENKKNEGEEMLHEATKDVCISTETASPDNQKEEEETENCTGPNDKTGSPLVTTPIDEMSSENAGLDVGGKLEENSSIAFEERSHEAVEPMEKMRSMTFIQDEIQDVPETGSEGIAKKRQNESQIEIPENTVIADSSLSRTYEDRGNPEPKVDSSFMKHEDSSHKEGEELAPEEASTVEYGEDRQSIIVEDNIEAAEHSKSEMSEHRKHPEHSFLPENEPGKEKLENSLDMASEKIESTASNEYAETNTQVKEQRPIESPEDILDKTRKGDAINADDINKKEIPEEKTLATVYLSEKTESAEVEIPNKNANDLYVTNPQVEVPVQMGGENLDKVPTSVLDEQIQEADVVPIEENTRVNEAYEARNRLKSDNLDQTASEGKLAGELTSGVREMEDDRLGKVEMDSEEKLQVKDAANNTKEEMQLEEEVTDTELQSITTKGDNEKSNTDQDVPVKGSNTICSGEGADGRNFQENENGTNNSEATASELNDGDWCYEVDNETDNNDRDINKEVYENRNIADMNECTEKQIKEEETVTDHSPESTAEETTRDFQEEKMETEKHKAEMEEELGTANTCEGIEKKVTATEKRIQQQSMVSIEEETIAEISKDEMTTMMLKQEIKEEDCTAKDNFAESVEEEETKEDCCHVEEKQHDIEASEEYETAGASTNTENQIIEESVIIDLHSLTDEENLKGDERDVIKSKDEVKNLKMESQEKNLETTNSTEERKLEAAKDEAKPNENCNAQSIAGTSEEEILPKECNEDLVERSSTVPEVSEKEIKEEISQKAESIKETSFKEAKAEDGMQVECFDLTSEEKSTVTIETGETRSDSVDIIAKPEEMSNSIENKDMVNPTGKHGADEAREEIEHEMQNETHCTLPKSEDQIEVATDETPSNDISGQNLESSLTVSLEKHNLVTTEASETKKETTERHGTSKTNEEAPSVSETTEEKLMQNEKSTDSIYGADMAHMGSVDIEKDMANKEVQDAEQELNMPLELNNEKGTSESDAELLKREKSSEVADGSEIGKKYEKALDIELEKDKFEDPVDEGSKCAKACETNTDTEVEAGSYSHGSEASDIRSISTSTEEVSAEVDRPEENENIKEIEGESCTKELHMISGGTVHEVKDPELELPEHPETTGSNKDTETVRSKDEEDINWESEASAMTKTCLEEELKKANENPVDVSSSVPEGIEEKIKEEEVEETGNCNDKTDAAAKVVTKETSLEEIQQDDKSVKASDTSSETKILETIQTTEPSLQDEEIDSMKLAETSQMVYQLPKIEHGNLEKGSTNLKNSDADEAVKTKILDAVPECKDQCVEETREPGTRLAVRNTDTDEIEEEIKKVPEPISEPKALTDGEVTSNQTLQAEKLEDETETIKEKIIDGESCTKEHHMISGGTVNEVKDPELKPPENLETKDSNKDTETVRSKDEEDLNWESEVPAITTAFSEEELKKDSEKPVDVSSPVPEEIDEKIEEEKLEAADKTDAAATVVIKETSMGDIQQDDKSVKAPETSPDSETPATIQTIESSLHGEENASMNLEETSHLVYQLPKIEETTHKADTSLPVGNTATDEIGEEIKKVPEPISEPRYNNVEALTDGEVTSNQTLPAAKLEDESETIKENILDGESCTMELHMISSGTVNEVKDTELKPPENLETTDSNKDTETVRSKDEEDLNWESEVPAITKAFSEEELMKASEKHVDVSSPVPEEIDEKIEEEKLEADKADAAATVVTKETSLGEIQQDDRSVKAFDTSPDSETLATIQTTESSLQGGENASIKLEETSQMVYDKLLSGGTVNEVNDTQLKPPENLETTDSNKDTETVRSKDEDLNWESEVPAITKTFSEEELKKASEKHVDVSSPVPEEIDEKIEEEKLEEADKNDPEATVVTIETRLGEKKETSFGEIQQDDKFVKASDTSPDSKTLVPIQTIESGLHGEENASMNLEETSQMVYRLPNIEESPHEAGTSLPVGNTAKDEIEEEIKKVPEAISGPRYNNIEAVTDGEVISNRTLPAEKLENETETNKERIVDGQSCTMELHTISGGTVNEVKDTELKPPENLETTDSNKDTETVRSKDEEDLNWESEVPAITKAFSEEELMKAGEKHVDVSSPEPGEIDEKIEEEKLEADKTDAAATVETKATSLWEIQQDDKSVKAFDTSPDSETLATIQTTESSLQGEENASMKLEETSQLVYQLPNIEETPHEAVTSLPVQNNWESEVVGSKDEEDLNWESEVPAITKSFSEEELMKASEKPVDVSSSVPEEINEKIEEEKLEEADKTDAVAKLVTRETSLGEIQQDDKSVKAFDTSPDLQALATIQTTESSLQGDENASMKFEETSQMVYQLPNIEETPHEAGTSLPVGNTTTDDMEEENKKVPEAISGPGYNNIEAVTDGEVISNQTLPAEKLEDETETIKENIIDGESCTKKLHMICGGIVNEVKDTELKPPENLETTDSNKDTETVRSKDEEDLNWESEEPAITKSFSEEELMNASEKPVDISSSVPEEKDENIEEEKIEEADKTDAAAKLVTRETSLGEIQQDDKSVKAFDTSPDLETLPTIQTTESSLLGEENASMKFEETSQMVYQLPNIKETPHEAGTSLPVGNTTADEIEEETKKVPEAVSGPGYNNIEAVTDGEVISNQTLPAEKLEDETETIKEKIVDGESCTKELHMISGGTVNEVKDTELKPPENLETTDSNKDTETVRSKDEQDLNWESEVPAITKSFSEEELMKASEKPVDVSSSVSEEIDEKIEEKLEEADKTDAAAKLVTRETSLGEIQQDDKSVKAFDTSPDLETLATIQITESSLQGEENASMKFEETSQMVYQLPNIEETLHEAGTSLPVGNTTTDEIEEETKKVPEAVSGPGYNNIEAVTDGEVISNQTLPAEKLEDETETIKEKIVDGESCTKELHMISGGTVNEVKDTKLKPPENLQTTDSNKDTETVRSKDEEDLNWESEVRAITKSFSEEELMKASEKPVNVSSSAPEEIDEKNEEEKLEEVDKTDAAAKMVTRETSLGEIQQDDKSVNAFDTSPDLQTLATIQTTESSLQGEENASIKFEETSQMVYQLPNIEETPHEAGTSLPVGNTTTDEIEEENKKVPEAISGPGYNNIEAVTDGEVISNQTLPAEKLEDETETIKEKIVDGESCTMELHMISGGTVNEVKETQLKPPENLETTDSNKDTETARSKDEEDLNWESEVPAITKAFSEEKLMKVGEKPVDVSSPVPEEIDEKIEEEKLQEADKTDAAATVVTKETSLGEIQQDDKSVKAFDTSPDSEAPATIQTAESSLQGEENASMKLEETSQMVNQLPKIEETRHEAGTSLPVGNTATDDIEEEVKKVPEAISGPGYNNIEAVTDGEIISNQTLPAEKLEDETETIKEKIIDGESCSTELHMISGGTVNEVKDPELEPPENLETTDSNKDTETVGLEVEENSNWESEPSAITKAFTEEELKIATEKHVDVSSSVPEEVEEKIKEEKVEVADNTDAAATVVTKETSLGEIQEGDKSVKAFDTSPDSESEGQCVEETCEIGTSLTAGKIDTSETEEEIKKVPETICEPRYNSFEAGIDGEIDSNQTLPAKEIEEQLQVPSSALLFKEQDHDMMTTIEKIEDGGAKNNETELDSMKLEETSGMESQLLTTEHENADQFSGEKSDAAEIKLEQTKIPDSVTESKVQSCEEIHETGRCLAMEKIDADETEQEIKEIPATISGTRNQGVESVTNDEMTPNHTLPAENLEEQLQVPYSASLYKEQECETTTTIEKLEDDSTKKEIDSIIIEETSGMVSQLPIMDMSATVEKLDANEVKIEETKTFDAVCESKDQGVEDIYETGTITVEKNDADEMVEEIKEVPETISEHIYQGAETASDREITPEQTFPAGEMDEQLQMPSSLLLPKEQEHETTTTMKRIEDESTKKDEEEIGNMKLEESSAMASQLPKIDCEVADNVNVTVETSKADELEVEETKISIEANDSKDHGVEEIHESETSLTVGKTDIDTIEEIKEVPKIISGPKYQGLEAFTEGGITPEQTLPPGKSEQQLQEPSPVFLFNENDGTKKDHTQVNEDLDSSSATGTVEETCFQKEKPRELGVSELELKLTEETKKDSPNEAQKEEKTVLEGSPAVEPQVYVSEITNADLPSDTEKRYIQCSSQETLKDENILDSENPNKEADDLPSSHSTVKEILPGEEVEKCEEASNLGFEKTGKVLELVSEVHSPDVLTKPEETKITEEPLGAATGELRTKDNQSEEITEASETIKNELSSKKIKEADDERVTTSNQEDEINAEEYSGEKTDEKTEITEKGISNKEFDELEKMDVNKNVEEIIVGEDRAVERTYQVSDGDGTASNSLLEEAEEKNNAKRAHTDLDIKDQGDETMRRDIAAEATALKLTNADLPSDTEKSYIQCSSQETLKDEDILDSENPNKEADDLPSSHSTVKEILPGEEVEKCEEASNLGFEKTGKVLESVSEVHSPDVLTKPEEMKITKEPLGAATGELRTKDNQSEEITEASETIKNELSSKKIKEADDERVTTSNQEDEIKAEEYSGEKTDEKIEITEKGISNKEFDELEKTDVNKNVEEITVGEDRAVESTYQVSDGDGTASNNLLEEAEEKNNAKRAHTDLDIKDQGDETKSRDIAAEATALKLPNADLPSDTEKRYIQCSSQETLKDEDILDSENPNKEADDLPSSHSTVKEILPGEEVEKCEEASNLRFEKTGKVLELVSEVHSPDVLTKPEKMKITEEPLGAAIGELRTKDNQSEEITEASETIKNELSSKKIKEADDERVTTSNQEDEIRAEEYSGEKTDEKTEFTEKGISNKEFDELEKTDVNKNVEEIIVGEDRAVESTYQVSDGDGTASNNLLEEAEQKKNARRAHTDLDIKDQGDETKCRDIAAEAAVQSKEVDGSEVVLVKPNEDRIGAIDKEIVIRKDEESQNSNLDDLPVRDAAAEEAADKRVGEKIEEVPEPAPREPTYKIIKTQEENKETAMANTNNSESVMDNERPQHTSLEWACSGSDAIEGLNLKEQEAYASEQSTLSHTETSRKEMEDNESEKTVDEKQNDLKFDDQKTDEVGIEGGGKNITCEGEHRHDEDQVKLSTRGNESKLDEAEVHNTITAIEGESQVQDEELRLNVLADIKDSIMTISQEDGIVDLAEDNETPKDTPVLKTTTLALSDQHIPRESDANEGIEATVSIGNKDVTPVQQDPIAKTFQNPEEDDLKAENASGAELEEKRAECGEEKRMGDECEEKTEKSTSIESTQISLSDLLQGTTKETSQVAKHLTEERELLVNKELQTEKAEIARVEEAKTIDDRDEVVGGEEHKREDSGSDAPVMVEASRDVDVKIVNKKSHNILSGVGSKVKHSIAKVKKVITGKASQCSHPRTQSHHW